MWSRKVSRNSIQFVMYDQAKWVGTQYNLWCVITQSESELNTICDVWSGKMSRNSIQFVMCDQAKWVGTQYNLWCMIRQNESELNTICDVWSGKMSWNLQILILKYSQTKQIISFVSYCFWNSTAHIFRTSRPLSMESVEKGIFANNVCN